MTILWALLEIVLTHGSPDQRTRAIYSCIRARKSLIWVLLTSEYVEGKTEGCNRFIDPKSGHDKSVFRSVTQIVELIDSLNPAKMDSN